MPTAADNVRIGRHVGRAKPPAPQACGEVPLVPWRTIGEALRRTRDVRRQTQSDFAHEIGISVRLLGQLEAGERRQYDPTTIHRVESALGWSHGSFDRVINGQPPVVEADPLFARIRDAWPRLPIEARRLLSELAGRALGDDGDVDDEAD